MSILTSENIQNTINDTPAFYVLEYSHLNEGQLFLGDQSYEGLFVVDEDDNGNRSVGFITNDSLSFELASSCGDSRTVQMNPELIKVQF